MNIDNALRLAVQLAFPAEGCELTAYLDKLAKPPVWTIGHGTTRVNGQPVRAGMTCTQEQADLWAAADLRSAAEQVLHVVKVPLSDPQLAALTSLVDNIGIGHFRSGSVLEALNLGLYSVAATRILEYDHAGGQVVHGLDTRRGRERALFLTGTLIPASLPAATPALSEADQLNQIEITRVQGGAA